MRAVLKDTQTVAGRNLTFRCPHCGNTGTFMPVSNDIKCFDENNRQIFLGIRKCPNPECRGHLFVIYNSQGFEIVDSYPVARIEFQKDSIPPQISDTFEEAISCYANKCYIASAIMVRKTLEQLCEDKGAEGRNLKEKVKALVSTITMPQELKEGIDVLRVLGNNAAHVELTDFDAISEKELEISIEFAKEILKSVYQFDKLLTALKSLRKQN